LCTFSGVGARGKGGGATIDFCPSLFCLKNVYLQGKKTCRETFLASYSVSFKNEVCPPNFLEFSEVCPHSQNVSTPLKLTVIE